MQHFDALKNIEQGQPVDGPPPEIPASTEATRIAAQVGILTLNRDTLAGAIVALARRMEALEGKLARIAQAVNDDLA